MWILFIWICSLTCDDFDYNWKCCISEIMFLFIRFLISFQKFFWRALPSKILTDFSEIGRQKVPCNIFWRTSPTVKKPAGVKFWRTLSPSKKPSKLCWRDAGSSKNTVGNFLTEIQSVKASPPKDLTARSKIAFRRSFFWPTIFRSKWPSKIAHSVKKLTIFRQKFRQKATSSYVSLQPSLRKPSSFGFNSVSNFI